MTKSTKIREIDLKPYQTHYLFQSGGPLTSSRIEKLVKEIPAILDDGLEDDDDRAEILAQGSPAPFPRMSRSRGSRTAKR